MPGQILCFHNGPEKTCAPVGFPQGINQIQNACAFCHSTPNWLNTELTLSYPERKDFGNAEHLPSMGYGSVRVFSAGPLRVEIFRLFPDSRLRAARSLRY